MLKINLYFKPRMFVHDNPESTDSFCLGALFGNSLCVSVHSLYFWILWEGVYFHKECLSLSNNSSGNLPPQTVILVINLELGRINLDMIPNEI